MKIPCMVTALDVPWLGNSVSGVGCVMIIVSGGNKKLGTTGGVPGGGTESSSPTGEPCIPYIHLAPIGSKQTIVKSNQISHQLLSELILLLEGHILRPPEKGRRLWGHRVRVGPPTIRRRRRHRECRNDGGWPEYRLRRSSILHPMWLRSRKELDSIQHSLWSKKK